MFSAVVSLSSNVFYQVCILLCYYTSWGIGINVSGECQTCTFAHLIIQSDVVLC